MSPRKTPKKPQNQQVSSDITEEYTMIPVITVGQDKLSVSQVLVKQTWEKNGLGPHRLPYTDRAKANPNIDQNEAYRLLATYLIPQFELGPFLKAQAKNITIRKRIDKERKAIYINLHILLPNLTRPLPEMFLTASGNCSWLVLNEMQSVEVLNSQLLHMNTSTGDPVDSTVLHALSILEVEQPENGSLYNFENAHGLRRPPMYYNNANFGSVYLYRGSEEAFSESYNLYSQATHRYPKVAYIAGTAFSNKLTSNDRFEITLDPVTNKLPQRAIAECYFHIGQKTHQDLCLTGELTEHPELTHFISFATKIENYQTRIAKLSDKQSSLIQRIRDQQVQKAEGGYQKLPRKHRKLAEAYKKQLKEKLDAYRLQIKILVLEIDKTIYALPAFEQSIIRNAQMNLDFDPCFEAAQTSSEHIDVDEKQAKTQAEQSQKFAEITAMGFKHTYDQKTGTDIFTLKDCHNEVVGGFEAQPKNKNIIIRVFKAVDRWADMVWKAIKRLLQASNKHPHIRLAKGLFEDTIAGRAKAKKNLEKVFSQEAHNENRSLLHPTDDSDSEFSDVALTPPQTPEKAATPPPPMHHSSAARHGSA